MQLCCMQQGNIHGTTMLHATLFMQQCCMQYLIFMQLCCMKIEHVQFPCNMLHATMLRATINIHGATKLHATFQHTRCNKVACNNVVCNFVAWKI